ncbi:MAG: rRNA maturation RNase YbeY [Patescibacteria group bacterium]
MIRQITKIRPPRLSWQKIKNKILSPDYNLSLVFADSRLMAKLNRINRGKSQPTNVLAFELESNRGEIFLNTGLIRKEAENTGISFKKHTFYLYIHALLHLKGFGHKNETEEKIMKKEEKKWLKMSF